MLISTSDYMGGITIIRFKSRRLRADTLRFVDGACDHSKRNRRFGIVLDFAEVRAASISTIGALIELICRHPKLDFAFCDLNEKLSNLIAKSGMDRHLHIYASLPLALRSQQFRPHYLTTTRAILDLPAAPPPVLDLTDMALLAELDVLGRPLIEHFLANLSCFGVKEALICAPPECLAKIKPRIASIDHGMCLFFAPCAESDVPPRPNSFGTPSRQISDAVRHNISGSSPVLFSSIDRLESLKTRDIETIFEKATSLNTSELPQPSHSASTGSGYHFLTSDRFCQDSPAEANIVGFSPPRRALQSVPFKNTNPIKSFADYVVTLRLASKRTTTPLRPQGEEIAPDLWRAKGANLSHRARVNGFCYLGEAARVGPEAALKSFTVIGQNATVARRSLLDECVVLPKAQTTSNQIYRSCVIGAGEALSIAPQPPVKPSRTAQARKLGTHPASLGVA